MRKQIADALRRAAGWFDELPSEPDTSEPREAHEAEHVETYPVFIDDFPAGPLPMRRDGFRGMYL